MLIQYIVQIWEQYLVAAHREDTEERRDRVYTILVLHGKIRAAVWWITER